VPPAQCAHLPGQQRQLEFQRPALADATRKTGTFKQGQSELRAIRTVLGELDGANPSVNMGLMMFRSGSPGRDGGIVRYCHPQDEHHQYRRLPELIGTDAAVGDATTCAAGNNTVNGTPNCIRRISRARVSSRPILRAPPTAAAFLTLSSISAAIPAQPTRRPTRSRPARSTTPPITDRRATSAAIPLRAWTRPPNNVTQDSYVLGTDATENSCAKNYIVFIGNGFPSQDTGGTLIQNVNTGTTPALPTQLAMQNFTTIPSTVTHTLATDTACKSATQCAADASPPTAPITTPIAAAAAPRWPRRGVHRHGLGLPIAKHLPDGHCAGRGKRLQPAIPAPTAASIAGGSSTLASLVCESAFRLRNPRAHRTARFHELFLHLAREHAHGNRDRHELRDPDPVPEHHRPIAPARLRELRLQRRQHHRHDLHRNRFGDRLPRHGGLHFGGADDVHQRRGLYLLVLLGRFEHPVEHDHRDRQRVLCLLRGGGCGIFRHPAHWPDCQLQLPAARALPAAAATGETGR
jgi:hypothetical protein